MPETSTVLGGGTNHLDGTTWTLVHPTHQPFPVNEIFKSKYFPAFFPIWNFSTGWSRLPCQWIGWRAISSIPDWMETFTSTHPSWHLRIITSTWTISIWTMCTGTISFKGRAQGRLNEPSCTRGREPSRKTKRAPRPTKSPFPAALPVRYPSMSVSKLFDVLIIIFATNWNDITTVLQNFKFLSNILS